MHRGEYHGNMLFAKPRSNGSRAVERNVLAETQRGRVYGSSQLSVPLESVSVSSKSIGELVESVSSVQIRESPMLFVRGLLLRILSSRWILQIAYGEMKCVGRRAAMIGYK